MSDSPLFDPSVLDGLRKYGQAEFIGKMVEIFLLSTRDVPDEIAGLLAEKDWKGAAFAAHSLKSGCGSLGLVRLTELSGDIEKFSGLQSSSLVEQVAAGLPELYRQSCQVLQDYLAAAG